MNVRGKKGFWSFVMFSLWGCESLSPLQKSTNTQENIKISLPLFRCPLKGFQTLYLSQWHKLCVQPWLTSFIYSYFFLVQRRWKVLYYYLHHSIYSSILLNTWNGTADLGLTRTTNREATLWSKFISLDTNEATWASDVRQQHPHEEAQGEKRLMNIHWTTERQILFFICQLVQVDSNVGWIANK